MKTLSSTLSAAQLVHKRLPYFNLVFKRNETDDTIADYSCSGKPYDSDARLMYCRLHELPYASGSDSSESTITLNNDDRSILDLRGTYTDIGLGDITTAGNEYSTLPRMWVKKQENVSARNGCYTYLTLEGWAEALDEEHARLDNTAPCPSLYFLSNKTATSYALMSTLFDSAYSYNPFTLDALTVDDGIINTFLPYFEINTENDRYESKLTALYRLISMTKCYIKPLAAKHLSIIYPQDSDAYDLTIYSDAHPVFYEFHDIKNELIPNTIWAYCNDTGSTTNDYGATVWPSYILAAATDSEALARYKFTSKEHYQAGTITTSADALNYAEAVLERSKTELMSQSLVMPHHCGIELYDYIKVRDKKGQSAYHDTSVRVTGLTHTFSRKKRIYRLSVYGGGLSNFPMATSDYIASLSGEV